MASGMTSSLWKDSPVNEQLKQLRDREQFRLMKLLSVQTRVKRFSTPPVIVTVAKEYEPGKVRANLCTNITQDLWRNLMDGNSSRYR
jgi:hypothetical protein